MSAKCSSFLVPYAHSMNWQDNVARDDKTHGSAEKDITGKMITGGDTGEADGTSQAIGDERNPSMLAIPVCEHGGYRGRCHGVVRKESPRMERVVGAIEKAVRIGTVSRIREWLPSGRNRLQRNIQQKSVRDGFCCKQR